jgi:hypothetical protein
MDKEVKSLLNINIWEPIKKAIVPRYHRILKSKWVYKFKRDGTYKAR